MYKYKLYNLFNILDINWQSEMQISEIHIEPCGCPHEELTEEESLHRKFPYYLHSSLKSNEVKMIRKSLRELSAAESFVGGQGLKKCRYQRGCIRGCPCKKSTAKLLVHVVNVKMKKK